MLLHESCCDAEGDSPLAPLTAPDEPLVLSGALLAVLVVDVTSVEGVAEVLAELDSVDDDSRLDV